MRCLFFAIFTKKTNGVARRNPTDFIGKTLLCYYTKVSDFSVKQKERPAGCAEMHMEIYKDFTPAYLRIDFEILLFSSIVFTIDKVKK